MLSKSLEADGATWKTMLAISISGMQGDKRPNISILGALTTRIISAPKPEEFNSNLSRQGASLMTNSPLPSNNK
jgi:hypothetical protein